ncbi:MAG: hypothetical protein Q9201_001629 [Fulgogasparrea decipioides]
MAPQSSEADIIFNRASVALAKSQRLVASWLPPRTDDELRNAKTEEEIEQEEKELFTPVPEVLGLGANIPEDVNNGELKKQKLDSNDLLRKQLLGDDYAKRRGAGSHGQGNQRGIAGALPVGSKPRPAPSKRKAEDLSSSDEGGRSTLGKKKQREIVPFEQIAKSDVGALAHGGVQSEQPEDVRLSKKATSYLDEVLSQKQKKHKVKKKRKVGQVAQITPKG